jgi:hypothetical protein
MRSAELEALRRLLFFSAPEAARLVGGVSERAWQYWERGRRRIPRRVAETTLRLVQWRSRTIAAQIDAMERGPGAAPVSLVWYETEDDWMTLPGREAVLWRPHCSAVAELYATRPESIRLRVFDAEAYSQWLAGRADSEQMRAAWASSHPEESGSTTLPR